MNFVILTGRLTRDPEIRYTNSNKAVASFSLAVDDGKDRDGNKKTQFLDCVAWEKTAELLDQYFQKGDGLTVTGRLQKRQYEKDGEKRYVTEVRVNGIEFPLSRKDRNESVTKPNAFEDIDIDGELPF